MSCVSCPQSRHCHTDNYAVSSSPESCGLVRRTGDSAVRFLTAGCHFCVPVTRTVSCHFLASDLLWLRLTCKWPLLPNQQPLSALSSEGPFMLITLVSWAKQRVLARVISVLVTPASAGTTQGWYFWVPLDACPVLLPGCALLFVFWPWACF